MWLDDAPPPRAPLAGDASADVVVVGAGIAGLSVAYALQQAGAAVVVIEARHVAAAASGRNAGFILAGVAENYVAACRRYGAERANRVWRTTIANRVLLASLARRHSIDCDLRWLGSLQVAGSDEEWAELAESARAVSGHGVRVQVLPTERTVVYEDDGEMHPVRFVAGLADATAALGARVHERTCALSVRPGAVATDRGTVRAGAVVVCTNAYTEHLLRPSRIVPIRGQVLATEPLGRRVFERPAYASRGYQYWRQTVDGRVLVGGWRDTAFDEETGEEERTTERIQRELDAFLARHDIRARVTHRWAGIMGFSHDALPYVGRRADGIYVSGGFTGHGNAFAVLAGEIVASLIRTGRHPDADLFDPDRP